MPRANQIDPTSLRSRLRLFFLTNPGQHRPKDVAVALSEPTVTVSNECARMARTGILVKSRPPGSKPMGPGATYSLAPQTDPTPED